MKKISFLILTLFVMAECLSPLSLPNPNGKSVRDRVIVPCNSCMNCLENRRADWSFRLFQEMKISSSAYFITMTYEDSKLPSIDGVPTLVKKDTQLFMKRLRKEHAKISSDSLRYYLVGEYGSKNKRPHYHMCLFNLDRRVTDNLAVIPKNGYIDYKLSDVWTHGFVHLGRLEAGSIHYVTGYVLGKQDEPKGSLPVFSLMSRKPGLGQNYVKKAIRYHRNNYDTTVKSESGHRHRLPRFYKNQMFSRDEVEMMEEKNWSKKMELDEKFILKRSKQGKNPYEYKVLLNEEKRRKFNLNKKNKQL